MNIDLKVSELKNPLTLPILFYILTVLPSFINTSNITGSLIISLNFIAFLVIVFMLPLQLKKFKDIRFLLNVFLFFSLINALHVILIGLTTNDRFFGFAGVVFVDYVNIAIIISTIFLLVSNRANKLIHLLLLIAFSLASVLMQTRNAWLAFAITILFLIIFMFLKHKRIGLKKSKLFLITFTIIGFTLFIAVWGIPLNIQVQERISEYTRLEEKTGEEVFTSSLVTRILIWDTALNAFEAHPIVGIGFYSFPLESSKYYTIPKFLYNKFVKNLSPHVGYLAVLTETGIVGLIGFLIFLFYTLKIAYDSFKMSMTNKEIVFSLIILWCLVYIVFSLFMTDAWLWGSGIIVWGIFLAFNIFNYKSLKVKYYYN